jgi:CRISPR-associated protein Csm5
MQLKITTLSPIHIGNGERANGLSYVKHSGKIYFVEFDVLKDSFSKIPGAMDDFEAWMIKQSDLIDKLELQREQAKRAKNKEKEEKLKKELRTARESFSLTTYLSNGLQQKEAVDTILKHPRAYALNNKSRIGNNQDIELFIKQPDFRVYIPGSEVKGAIRTAVLYNKLEESHLTELEKKLGQVRSKKDLEGVDKWLQELLRDEEEKDAKHDLLRFVQVSDSKYLSPQNCLFVNQIETLGMRIFPLFQEVCWGDVLSNEKVEFSSSFNVSGSGIQEEVLFKNRKDLLSRSEILKCCHNFSKSLLEMEKKYPEFQNKHSILDRLVKIESQNKENAPVLRIGKGQGLLSITMDLLIKNYNLPLYVDLIEKLGKWTGKKLKRNQQTGQYDYENFPATRRVIVKDNDYLSLGWVKLELS